MNEVSIIINGVRYDAEEVECANCQQCDLRKDCDEYTFKPLCYALIPLCIFQKSNKMFEDLAIEKSQEKMVYLDKACEYLESALKHDLGYYRAADFADTFKKAMEGEI